jgi:hypothetical protein
MIINKRIIWHIPNTNIQVPEEINGGHTIRQQLRQQVHALTADPQSGITGYALSADITEANLPLRRK